MMAHFFTCRVIHQFASLLFLFYILFGIYTAFDPHLQLIFFALTPLVLILSLVDALILVVIAFQHVVLNSISLYSFLICWACVLSVGVLSIHETPVTLLPFGIVPAVGLYILCLWEMCVRSYLLFRVSEKGGASFLFFPFSPFILLLLTVISLCVVSSGVSFYHFADSSHIEYFIIILIARVFLHVSVASNNRSNSGFVESNSHQF